MPAPVNIGPRGARRRARLGTAGVAAAALYLAVLTISRAPLAWTVGLAPLVWLGGLGIFQARAKT